MTADGTSICLPRERAQLAIVGTADGRQLTITPLFTSSCTFLKTCTKGQLMVATCLDANNEIVILAVALVMSKTGQNWKWFFEQLIRDFTFNVIITDQSTGAESEDAQKVLKDNNIN